MNKYILASFVKINCLYYYHICKIIENSQDIKKIIFFIYITFLQVNILLNLFGIKSRDMEAPEIKKQFKKVHKNNQFQCTLYQHELYIEIASLVADSKTFYTQITNDSFQENLKFIFEHIEQLYDHFVDSGNPTPPFQIDNPSELIVQVIINRNRISKIPIFLSEKIMTKEQTLQRKVAKLQLQVNRLKIIEEEYQRLKIAGGLVQGGEASEVSINLRKQNENLVKQIRRLTQQQKKLRLQLQKTAQGKQPAKLLGISPKKSEEIQPLKQQISKLKQQINFHLAQRDKLKQQILSLNNKNISLSSELNSQNLIISQLTELTEHSRILIKDMTESSIQSSMILVKQQMAVINPQGQLLAFKPMSTSASIKFFEFKDNILTKNNATTSGLGRLIPNSTPVPNAGRYFYKLRMRFPTDPPNVRLGVTGRDLTNEAYLNGGDAQCIMYYSYSAGKEVLYEGENRLQGFPIKRNDILFIVIDQDAKTVQWHINGMSLNSNFTQSMITAQKLYFFIQLWTNGDSIETMTA